MKWKSQVKILTFLPQNFFFQNKFFRNWKDFLEKKFINFFPQKFFKKRVFKFSEKIISYKSKREQNPNKRILEKNFG